MLPTVWTVGLVQAYCDVAGTKGLNLLSVQQYGKEGMVQGNTRQEVGSWGSAMIEQTQGNDASLHPSNQTLEIEPFVASTH